MSISNLNNASSLFSTTAGISNQPTWNATNTYNWGASPASTTSIDPWASMFGNAYGTSTTATNSTDALSQMMDMLNTMLSQFLSSLGTDASTDSSSTSNANTTGSSSDDSQISDLLSSLISSLGDDGSDSSDSSSYSSSLPDDSSDNNWQPYNYDGGNSAKYWGDPHLVGFDGEKYDVMGQAGKTYNMISDKGLQYNTTFEKYHGDKDDATIIGKAGIQVGKSKVEFDRSGDPPTIDGKAMKKGDQVQLDEDGSASWDGKKLSVKTKEYNIDLSVEKDPKGDHINSDVSINKDNFGKDGVRPHGLLGQTADGVKGEHKGVNNTNDERNGGSVIDGTVSDYEVKNVFDNHFKFNRF